MIDRRIREVISPLDAGLYACHPRFVNGYLEALLGTVHSHCDSRYPVIGTIEYLHGCRVEIGLGAPESLVMIWPDWPAPYANTDFISTNPEPPPGTMWFWLEGAADTEFERRYLIPIAKARHAVRHFFQTGARSADIAREEQHFGSCSSAVADPDPPQRARYDEG